MDVAFEHNTGIDGVIEQDCIVPEQADTSEFRRDVIAGLSSFERSLPGKYLWDEAGSLIFDQICRSGTYYPTGREEALLCRAAPELSEIVGSKSCIVEFGSGASHKVRILLRAMALPKRYVAIDIAREFLSAAAKRIQGDYPAIEVMDVYADFSQPLPSLPIDRNESVLGLFLGTSIGNMPRTCARDLLTQLRASLTPGWLLIGQDPNTNPVELNRAYGGPLMAAFHKNILNRIRREIGAQVTIEHFQHEARFFEQPVRTEPHLVARCCTTILIDGYQFGFQPGESIRTDVSWKYSKPDFLALAAEAGWSSVKSWMDDDGLFGLHLLHSAL